MTNLREKSAKPVDIQSTSTNQSKIKHQKLQAKANNFSLKKLYAPSQSHIQLINFIFVSYYVLVSWCDQSDNSGYEKDEWFVIVLIVRKKSEKDAYLRRYRHFVKKSF